MVCAMWHHLYNFKNVKNTSVDISKAAGFSAGFQASASRFLNCTNGIKSCKASQVIVLCL